jgi:hypothetical protein
MACGARAAKLSQCEGLGMSAPERINPVAIIKRLRDSGHDLDVLLGVMNNYYAVAKYGSKTVVACINVNDVDFMNDQDFHKMFSNVTVSIEIKGRDVSPTKENKGSDGSTTKENKGSDGSATKRSIKLSKYWFDWEGRRQFLGRGVVFEPGSPPHVQGDMLNIWRGFGVDPVQGDWSLMRNHIRDVVCSGNDKHFRYLIKWMAYGVKYPDRPIGVAIALRGEEGAGKGFLWRNYGKLFGRHFKHVSQGEHLTGRFNAVLADTCAVFLDEALWAGDRKGEQILKALITEETFQLERKNYDPIPVKNRLRLMIASNNQWIVPIGTKGRRYAVFDVNDKYADEGSPEHIAHWGPLQAKFGDNAPDDGRCAMLYDLLNMDLTGFNVRAVPNSAAKTEQKLLSLKGSKAWVCHVLQEGAIHNKWNENGLSIGKDDAYNHYEAFSKQRREYQPEIKDMWAKSILSALGPCVKITRPTVNGTRVYSFKFDALPDCRRQFARHLGDPSMEWESDEPDELETPETLWAYEEDPLDTPYDEWEPETDADPEQQDEPPD